MAVWGVIPAAGEGTRIQPLAFSKELLPVGSRIERGVERPKAVSEYLVERMIAAGVERLCFVISPGKSDILAYYGSEVSGAGICYVVQERAGGLCDAVFRARPLVGLEDRVFVGLPDTVWFPEDGLSRLPDRVLSFLLFPVTRPEYFDAVVTDEDGSVRIIKVKHREPGTNWVWGAFGMPGAVFHELYRLWADGGGRDEYIGTLVNAYIARGGRAVGVKYGESYVDVGTLHGYREAVTLLSGTGPATTERKPEAEPGGPVPDARSGPASGGRSRDEIERRVRELGQWFHNIDLHGVKTAPDHFLGDYPNVKWRRFEHAIPEDLSGLTVLDIGCNAGFYSIEMKKRGADRVVGIDWDDDYLAQARFAAEVSGFPGIEFRKLSVYDVARLSERFDLVLFMGVLYHLRHPLLALDLIHEHVTRDLFVFQAMQRGSGEIEPLEPDYRFEETAVFDRPGFPRLQFIEHSYSGDLTNWWIPNRACVEAMLRSAGYRILAHPEEEVYVCRHTANDSDIAGPRTVYPASGAGTPAQEPHLHGISRTREPGSRPDG